MLQTEAVKKGNSSFPSLVGLLDPEHKGTSIVRNVCSYLAVDSRRNIPEDLNH